MLHWIYTAVVKPVVLYVTVVGWERARLKTAMNRLIHIQRLPCRDIMGAMRTTPSMAPKTLLNLSPLQLEVKGVAMPAAHRLSCWGQWIDKFSNGGQILIVELMRRASLLARIADTA